MRRLVSLGAFALVVIWLVINAGPASGQGTGNVTATVQVQAAACIMISPTSFTYAASSFSTSTAFTTSLPTSTKPSVTSCSTATQNFLAKGATATGSGANWALHTTFNCGIPETNRYKHEFKPAGGDFTPLTTTDQAWESAVPASSSRTLDTQLTMPCTASDGVGQTMSIPVTITAVVQ